MNKLSFNLADRDKYLSSLKELLRTNQDGERNQDHKDEKKITPITDMGDTKRVSGV